MRRNAGTRRNRGEYGGTHLSIFRTDVRQRVILCATTRAIHVGVAECSGNRQRSHENSLAFSFLQRRLPSTFVALAAFIDGKSVADLRSRISVEKPEERCHFSRRDCRRYMPHRKICRRRKLDRQISRGCLAQCYVVVAEASSHTSE